MGYNDLVEYSVITLKRNNLTCLCESGRQYANIQPKQTVGEFVNVVVTEA